MASLALAGCVSAPDETEALPSSADAGSESSLVASKSTEFVRLDPWASPGGPPGAKTTTYSLGNDQWGSGTCVAAFRSSRKDAFRCITGPGPGGSMDPCFVKPGSTTQYACVAKSPTDWTIVSGMTGTVAASEYDESDAAWPIFLELSNGLECTRFSGGAAPDPPPGGDYTLAAICDKAGGGVAGFLWASQENRSATGNSLWHGKSPRGFWTADLAHSGEMPQLVEVTRAYM